MIEGGGGREGNLPTQPGTKGARNFQEEGRIEGEIVYLLTFASMEFVSCVNTDHYSNIVGNAIF